MKTLIQIKEAELSLGGKKVLDRTNLDIREGEILAIIGPNGAGKSTLIDVILGLKMLDSGTIIRWTDNMQGKIGVQFQTPTFFPGLGAYDNVKLFAAANGKSVSKGEIEEVLRQCHLLDAAHTDAYRLSGGQQKRLAIAIALVHQPKLLILDEPTAALDPGARSEVKSMIASLAESRQISVVFTSHDMSEVSKLANRIAFIMNGRVHHEGSADELCSAYGTNDLEELYMLMVKKGWEMP
jgi:ABC-2 type transport system ATP-binding protein